MPHTDRRRRENPSPYAGIRYRKLAETMPQLIWATNPQGEVIYFNQRWYEYTGQSEDTALGFGFMAVVHPDDQERTAERWQLSWQNGADYQIEYRLRRHDGAYHWFLGRAEPVRTEDGEIVEWVGTCTDIDEQKRSNQAYAFLSRAIDLLNNTADHRRALQRVAELAVPDFADWCTFDLLNPDGTLERVATAHVDPQYVALAAEMRRRGNANPNYTLEVLKRGEPVHLERIDQAFLERTISDPEQLRLVQSLGFTSSMILPLISRGQPIGVMSLVAAESQRWFTNADLATAKQIAERFAQVIYSSRLNQELRRFRHTLDQTLDCVFMFEPTELCFIYVNQGAINQVGYSADELLTMTPIDLKPAYTEADFRALIAPLLDGEQPSISFETIHRHKDGHDIPVEIMLQYVVLAHEPIGRFVALVRDISERKQAAAALEERNRELDQFAYLISHDLKAPLRGIANLSQWIDEDLGENVSGEVREHLNLLHGRVQRMENLINGLLAYARVGRTTTEISEVAVDDLLAEVIDLLAPPAGVQITIAPHMPRFETDPLLLQQVFLNLISNAIKHHPGPDITIQIAVQAQGNMYCFSVRDNGAGIDPQYHSRIFGLFQTLVPKDQIESSGIGLAMVKKIVEHHGGTVEVQSQLGRGAVFSFTWPKVI